MKTLKLNIITALLLSMSLCSFGQATSKVHILNTFGRIVVEKSPKNYIKLKGYSLIETQQDSLYFTNKDNPISIAIERGKNYYFLIITYKSYGGSSFTGPDFRVEEVSEREFFLTLLLNGHGRKPDEVFSY